MATSSFPGRGPTNITTTGGSTGDVLTQQADGSFAPEAAASGAAWGDITGTLSAQTDLQSALDAKASALTSPLQIDDCALWLDASDATTINAGSPSNNDPVSAWADKSGNDYDAAQATAANRPIFKTNIQNGKSVVRFVNDGDAKFLGLSGDGLQLLTGATGITVAIAGICRTGGNDTAIGAHPASNKSRLQLAWIGGSPGNPASIYLSTVYDDDTAVYSPNQDYLSILGPSVSVLTLDLLGPSASSVTSGKYPIGAFGSGPILSGSGPIEATPITVFVIGGEGDQFNALTDTDICEIVIYTAALTASQRRDLLEYLSTKWGTL